VRHRAKTFTVAAIPNDSKRYTKEHKLFFTFVQYIRNLQMWLHYYSTKLHAGDTRTLSKVVEPQYGWPADRQYPVLDCHVIGIFSCYILQNICCVHFNCFNPPPPSALNALVLKNTKCRRFGYKGKL
jgi:hypothetical protein